MTQSGLRFKGSVWIRVDSSGGEGEGEGTARIVV